MNLQNPPKPKISTKRTLMLFSLLKSTELKFPTWVYQRPVTVSKSRSQTSIRNFQHSLIGFNLDSKDIDVLCAFKIIIKN